MYDCSFTLNYPMTQEDFDRIIDAELDCTPSVTFRTKSGKEIEYAKVVRCKDCKYYKTESGECPANNGDDPYYSWIPKPDWYCAEGKRKETE